ncbi:MAG: hypothetical protein JWQ35_2269 [Bacteriovoracaceae bacterium]|nr:hypothetical protein [Bacteriovoracaceae bacterium]
MEDLFPTQIQNRKILYGDSSYLTTFKLEALLDQVMLHKREMTPALREKNPQRFNELMLKQKEILPEMNSLHGNPSGETEAFQNLINPYQELVADLIVLISMSWGHGRITDHMLTIDSTNTTRNFLEDQPLVSPDFGTLNYHESMQDVRVEIARMMKTGIFQDRWVLFRVVTESVIAEIQRRWADPKLHKISKDEMNVRLIDELKKQVSK